MKADQQYSAGYAYGLKFLLFLFLITGSGKFASAQCPVNIDFELGNFTGWQCSQASFVPPGILTGTIVTGPIPGRHDIITAATTPAFDQYGLFPKLCPNGSGKSIRIGLETTGTHADIVTYTFTIPPGQNEFSLIYNYAIVINNSGGHPAAIQPRLEVSVTNLTDNIVDTCSSDTLAYSNANPLPGFQDCSFNPNIKFKPWAARSIRLDGNAGKTIEITFRGIGCGASGGTHFGYAYVDINSECTSSFIGATFCPDDAFINVTGPFGYQTYAWWNQNFTVPLGNTQTINFTPPPPPGTILKLVVNPYLGYGCTDTLTAILQDTLTIQSVAGPDQVSCNNSPAQLGAIPKPGYIYSWSPTTALSNPNISNPIATPSVTTTYVLTTKNAGGGCASTDTVTVFAAVLDNTITQTGPSVFCPDGTVSTVLSVLPADSIQWYLNGSPIPGANQTQYSVLQSGSYYATVFSFVGCSRTTVTKVITVYDMPVAGFNVNALDQCFNNHQFIFTNTSTVASGSMQYDWDLGDGTTGVATNMTHSYALPGTYIVKLLTTTNNGCKDSIFFTVNVYPSPLSGFNVNAANQCFKNHQFVFTNTSSISAGALQYNWDLGDGTTALTTNVTHSYAQPGIYIVKLVATSNNGCKDSTLFTVTVFPTPVAAFSVNTPMQQCFKDHQFIFTNTSTVFSGSLVYKWDMGNGTIFNTQDVSYSYPVPGSYTVKLLITATNGGCVDSTSINVIVHPTPVAGYTVNLDNQCLNNNQFVFTNTSTVYSGALQYNWTLGDGTIANTANVSHGYAQPGIYNIKLLVTADGGCVDSSSSAVTVFAYPVADFYVQPITCIELPVQIINKTINTTTRTLDYLWEFGNGQTSTLRSPAYSYPAPGNYNIKLSVNITGCPTPIMTRQLPITIEAPAPGIRYPDFDARFNFPEVLHSRQIGSSVLWSPPTSLDNRFIHTPTFKGINSQLYTIQLKTDIGCITTDTQFVKTIKKIEIYVPTVFTPDNNGMNDLLRPLLFGFAKVNYFRIYDRWGKLLFQMQSDRPGWDGKLGGKPAEMQTVVWMIEAIDIDGNLHRKQGTTVLIR